MMTFAAMEKEKKVLTMAEYIEREALIREIERREALMVGDKLVSVYAMKSFIKNRPSADVAPVVRCRDCKHAWIHPCGYVYCHRDGRNAYEMTFNLDSFCSYGERKDNG